MTDHHDNWLAEQVRTFNEVCGRFAALREVLQRALSYQARGLSPEIIVQSRVKTAPSFVGKILRKRSKYHNPVRQLTDLCGARVIAGSSDETRHFSRFIEDHFDVDWENSAGRESNLLVNEFGYRSIHYIVSLRPGVALPGEGGPPPSAACPGDGLSMKAEIQVRTFLEHAWAVFGHDRIYKSEFEVPPVWQRELAAQAAALESADQAFARIGAALDGYATHYGSYLEKNEIKRELAIIRTMLDYDPENHAQALKGAKLASALGDWSAVAELLGLRSDQAPPKALMELGNALCRQHADQRHAPGFQQGLEFMERALKAMPGHPMTSLLLAGFLRATHPERSRQLVAGAFEANPSDPYVLWTHLQDLAESAPHILPNPALRPLLEQAIARCREQILVKVNRPAVFFTMGALQLLQGEPWESLNSHAQGILYTTAPHMLDDALREWQRIARLQKELPAWRWINMLLLAARCARFPGVEAYRQALLPLRTPAAEPFKPPVVILAGGCAEAVEPRMREFGQQLPEVFKSYRGMVVSGGTRQGVAGLAGDLGERYPEAIHPVGYVPRMVPNDARTDLDPTRYRHIYETDGAGFSPLEPLQSWIDLLADGVDPSRVLLLGFNGGVISQAEYRMALAMGGRVGLVEESGRSASKMLQDPDWNSRPGLIPLTADDPATWRQFLHSNDPSWIDNDQHRETLARTLHNNYVKGKTSTKDGPDAPWEKLKEDFKHSNRRQADNIAFKLEEIGCRIVPLPPGPSPRFAFTLEEIEHLSELEHGRWNAERLASGWRRGKRDDARKLHDNLVPWSALPEHIKKYDRDFVLGIPDLLAHLGMTIACSGERFFYPPREERESDGEYLKRVASSLPTPSSLPETPDHYFLKTEGAKLLPLDLLISSKSEAENEKGGLNSPKFMMAAYHGVVARRPPITVRPTPDGAYTVVDGNGTLAGVRRYGWKSIPVVVVGADQAATGVK